VLKSGGIAQHISISTGWK